MKILVIDDSAAIRRILIQTLNQCGHVDAADSSGAALNMMRSTAYDVIVSDLRMSDTRHTPPTRWLRQLREAAGESARIILNSANDSDEVTSECNQLSIERMPKGDNGALRRKMGISDPQSGVDESEIQSMVVRYGTDALRDFLVRVTLWDHQKNEPKYESMRELVAWSHASMANQKRWAGWKEKVGLTLAGAIAVGAFMWLARIIEAGLGK